MKHETFSAVKYFKYFILTVAGALLLAELLLQAYFYFGPKSYIGNPKEGGFQQKAMREFVNRKIQVLWSRSVSDRKSFYEPPFQTFVNRGFDDKKRLAEIAERSKLPPNSKQIQQDFLRLNKNPSDGLYTVTANHLGFRGAEVTEEKPAKTYRVIVLGSYPAFGHAVNDSETYSAYLEKLLNQKYGKKIHFEVWNGGRQGGSIIMGVSRLENEIAAYKPDLIIWDYGWIEMYIVSDVTTSDDSIERLKMIKPNPVTAEIYMLCQSLPHSALCSQFITKLEKVGKQEALQGWRDGMDYLKEWSKKMNVPVIFLHHTGVAVPRAEYEKYNNPADRFYFLESSDSLKELLNEKEVEQFWATDNWLSEQGYTKEDAAKEDKSQFYSDAIQYNKIAYNRFAHMIFDFMNQHSQELKIPSK
jgi:hypothetical protein